LRGVHELTEHVEDIARRRLLGLGNDRVRRQHAGTNKENNPSHFLSPRQTIFRIGLLIALNTSLNLENASINEGISRRNPINSCIGSRGALPPGRGRPASRQSPAACVPCV